MAEPRENLEFNPHRSAAMIALAYAVTAGLWIVLSDKALLWVWPGATPAMLTRLESLKGCAFVGVTALLLYLLVMRRLRSLLQSQAFQRESDARYRRLIDTVREGIWTLDREGRTTFVNQEMTRMFGIPPEQFIGIDAATLVDPAHYATWRDLLQPSTESTRLAPDLLLRRKDGSELWAIVGVSPGDQNLRAAWLVMVTDITVRRRADEQLRRAQRLEAVGRLAGGLAHDFNNLLAIIGGYTESVQRHLPPGSPAAGHMAEIQKAADRGADLIRRLLTFARTESTELLPVDLASTLSEMFPMLRRLIPSLVGMTLDPLPARLPVMAGAGQLEQVVMNLVVNAADAMPSGGSMRITGGQQSLDMTSAAPMSLPPGDYATLCVSDTGFGMDTATRAHVFEPFFTTKKDKGTGLGLSVVYGIVQECGGQIGIDSTPGQGTTVRIWLPLLKDAPSEKDEPETFGEAGASNS